MAKSETSEKFQIYGRLSYPKLAKPEAYAAGQTAKFQTTILLDPSDAQQAAMIAIVKQQAGAICQKAFGEIPPNIPKNFGMADKLDKVPEGYKGMFFVRLSNDARPGVANRAGRPVVEGEPQWPYAGCYVNVKATLWAQHGYKDRDGKWVAQRRINGNLIAVQFVKDGEAFGRGPINVEDEFEPLPEAGGGSSGGKKAPADAFDDDIPF